MDYGNVVYALAGLTLIGGIVWASVTYMRAKAAGSSDQDR